MMENPFLNVPAHRIQTVGDILRVLEPKAHQVAPQMPLTGFKTDSRSVEPGNVFVAIKGARVDGHDYLDQARAKGAVACLVSDRSKVHNPANCVWVDEPVQALGRLAAAHRRAMPTKIIAVTGSVGKTTTKEILHAILASAFRSRKSSGNFNSTIGLPMELLKIEPNDEWFVAEMGMSTPGEITKLMQMAKPDVGLWTCVKPVHLASFRSIDDIAAAKAEMVRHLDPGKTMVYNRDDPLVHQHCRSYSGRRFAYAFLHPEADIRARIKPFCGWKGTSFELRISETAKQPLTLPLVGRYNVDNALAACAAALAVDFPAAELVNGLRAFRPARHRSNLFNFERDISLVDDTYNASPHAVQQVLRTFAMLPPEGYRWLVLGDMLELGNIEETVHRKLGKRLAEQGFNRITLVGKLSHYTYEALNEANRSDCHIEHFENVEAAISSIKVKLPAHSRVWCKASRGIHLERLVTAIVAKIESETSA